MAFCNPFTIIGLYCMSFFVSCTEKEYDTEESLSTTDCIACERIGLFSSLKNRVDSTIWMGLNDASHAVPLLYYTDSSTYAAFADNEIFGSNTYQEIGCDGGMKLKKLYNRLDAQPFHMENRMSFRDTTSLFYFRPMMLCSDVETMHQFVPDFDKTEDWLQLVMHEYFHGYQFSHGKTINYMAHTIKISADTLNAIYMGNEAFRVEIDRENQLLLKAIETSNKDSLNYYVNEFHTTRNQRRRSFEDEHAFKLRSAENFWETIEGTARYTEYYMAGIYNESSPTRQGPCDTLFHNFAEYAGSVSFEQKEEFRERTKIMPAYYYVTGFNLCRLMDKLGIEYKKELFENPQRGLYEIFLENT